MGAGVVSIGRRRYAAGLYWENSPSGRVAQAAKEAAQQAGEGAAFFAVRSGNKDGRVPQFGLGQTAAGHKAGLPALAACLANQQHGAWAGGFRLREGSIVIVMRDDLIVPDGDQFYANESEARDRLLQEISFGGLQKVYAPESWAISGADTMPISLLLNDRADVKLRPVAVPKNVFVIGAVAATLLLLAVGGGFWWQEYLAQQESERLAHEAQIKRFQDEINKNLPAGLQAAPKYPDPERKWEKAPRPMDVIRACQEGLAKVPAVALGWKLNVIKCTGASLSGDWSIMKGFAKVLPGAVINETGSAATFSVNLPPLVPRTAPEEILNQKDITQLYLNQNWPGSIARAPDDPLPPPPPGYQVTWAPPPPPWIKRSFTLSVPELPSTLSTYLEKLPGAIVTDLSSTPGGTWTIQGVIYENK